MALSRKIVYTTFFVALAALGIIFRRKKKRQKTVQSLTDGLQQCADPGALQPTTAAPDLTARPFPRCSCSNLHQRRANTSQLAATVRSRTLSSACSVPSRPTRPLQEEAEEEEEVDDVSAETINSAGAKPDASDFAALRDQVVRLKCGGTGFFVQLSEHCNVFCTSWHCKVCDEHSSTGTSTSIKVFSLADLNEVTVGQEVYQCGFAFGSKTAWLLKGIIARLDENNSIVGLDATAVSGMSGSPIVVWQNGGWAVLAAIDHQVAHPGALVSVRAQIAERQREMTENLQAWESSLNASQEKIEQLTASFAEESDSLKTQAAKPSSERRLERTTSTGRLGPCNCGAQIPHFGTNSSVCRYNKASLRTRDEVLELLNQIPRATDDMVAWIQTIAPIISATMESAHLITDALDSMASTGLVNGFMLPSNHYSDLLFVGQVTMVAGTIPIGYSGDSNDALTEKGWIHGARHCQTTKQAASPQVGSKRHQQKIRRPKADDVHGHSGTKFNCPATKDSRLLLQEMCLPVFSFLAGLELDALACNTCLQELEKVQTSWAADMSSEQLQVTCDLHRGKVNNAIKDLKKTLETDTGIRLISRRNISIDDWYLKVEHIQSVLFVPDQKYATLLPRQHCVKYQDFYHIDARHPHPVPEKLLLDNKNSNSYCTIQDFKNLWQHTISNLEKEVVKLDEVREKLFESWSAPDPIEADASDDLFELDIPGIAVDDKE
eukprot:INCI8891.1.p1 GENE.INCI8891.1~~INCI8891.1.p1  ORF type:complete len:721 (+),score=98.16 INCI8891.1:97-2259(+)